MPELPFVSLLMPIRNEAAFIKHSLGAVLAQDYPADRMEILVADGLSTDGTRDIIANLAINNPQSIIHTLDNPGHIVSTGLNIALRQAQGDVIVRVDGHCEIAPDYVTRCVAHLQTPGVQAVGGPLETVGLTPLAQTIAIAMSTPFGVGGSPFRTITDKTMLVDSVAFPAYARAAVERAGLFDEELVRNQDDEYNYRLRKLGVQILLAPDVRARYYSRASLSALCRQYFQYGYWKVRVLQKHPAQMRPRQFAPPLFVAALIGSAVLAPFATAGQFLLAAIGGVYLVANLIASLWTARQRGWRHLPLLPLVFAILHVSYGLGFLLGLVKFWNRWGR